ncbi:MAG TPA: FkbM family methyltransferase [Nostocaceae cyanobacterium]|nr:FkbM family methyltransferase [Nostocaceae cyanobacterium]
MNSNHHASHVYLQYVQELLPNLNANIFTKINSILEQTNWDEPDSCTDWHNIAVVALIEAEQCIDDLMTRSVYMEMAFEAFNNSFDTEQHPLCAAHIALFHNIIGDKTRALEIAFNSLVNTLQTAYTSFEHSSNYLLYIPHQNKINAAEKQNYLEQIWLAENSYQQALLLLGKLVTCSQLVFYSAVSRRFLHIADQITPNSVNLWLKLGISYVMSGQPEGILYLQKARKLEPESAPILHSLYLAYRDLNQIEIAQYWQETSKQFYQTQSSSLDWYWTQLPQDSPFTYINFERKLIMAVEPSLRSIATSVLIAEQDWFEKEMEFWRNNIQPGMTVIDVGANVGVYTFSAALKVGSEGKVLAVEPFSVCVRCLQETCRINQLSWVKVCAGAASDTQSSIKLLLHSANELNQVIVGDAAENLSPGSFEEVPCFTLDSLIEQEGIENVDFLKIDAEGHEMAVLAGSQQLINQFFPVILYENIAGSQGSNVEVAQYLSNLGYALFYYQPYLQKLIPVNSAQEFQEQLNFIAVPPHKNYMFNF